MRLFSYIYIILLIVGIITLVIYYVLDTKFKIINQNKILDKIIPELKKCIVVYFNTYLKYIKSNKKYLDAKNYKELSNRIEHFNNINDIQEIIDTYNLIDAELESIYIFLEDNGLLIKKEFKRIEKLKEEFNAKKENYNYNVLILDKYLNMFSTIFIARIYKFKEYPYFRVNY